MFSKNCAFGISMLQALQLSVFNQKLFFTLATIKRFTVCKLNSNISLNAPGCSFAKIEPFVTSQQH